MWVDDIFYTGTDEFENKVMKKINEEFLKKFKSYDNHIRPNPEEPLEVTITLLVQSWNPIITFIKNADFLINRCLKL